MNLLRLIFGSHGCIDDYMIQAILITKVFKYDLFLDFSLIVEKCRRQIVSKLKSIGLQILLN